MSETENISSYISGMWSNIYTFMTGLALLCHMMDDANFLLESMIRFLEYLLRLI